MSYLFVKILFINDVFLTNKIIHDNREVLINGIFTCENFFFLAVIRTTKGFELKFNDQCIFA